MNGSFPRASATLAQIPELGIDYEGSEPVLRARIDSTFADFLTSAILTKAGFRHAFFTRRGGVSEGPYASLNFSASVSDSKENVARNLERAGGALGVPGTKIFFLSQVHGVDVAIASGTEDPARLAALPGDAIVSRSPSCAVAVRVADCMPILVGDVRQGAATAIHAGWRGLAAGVIEAGVATLREVVGDAGDLVAAIGPHITVKGFEVSDDVAATLAALAPGIEVVDRTLGEKPHVDLARIATQKLVALGLREENIEVVPGCTHGDATRFFSFRRDGKFSGRHLAAIVPKAPT